MNKIKQPESGVLSSKPSTLTNLGGAALLAITTGFAGKTEAATLDTPTFDTPTLIAGADTSADELSPGVDPATGDIAFVVPDGSDYNLTILPAGSSTASTVSGMNDAWNPIHIDSDNKYILSGGGNNVYQATTTDSWGSASASELYSDAAYNIDGDVALDPDADPASLNTGEFLKTYTNPTTRTTEITDLFDESYVVAEDTGHQMNPAFASNGRLLYMNNGYAYFKDLNGVYDDVAAPELDDCVTWAYDTLNNDVICSDGTDLYRFHETTYASTTVDADGDGEDSTVDCDDTDPAINSSAAEECDGVDNNCDGSIDGMDSIDVSTWYRDADSDGVGGATTQEACDAPSGYVATGGDWDDSDPTVQTEPTEEPGVCEEESETGPYTPDETICAPEAEGEVYEGEVIYYSDADTSELDSGDWLALVGQMGLDMSTYQDRYVFTPSTDFEGGFGLGISDDAMEAKLHANMAPAAPPSEDGSTDVVTFYIDGGSLTVEDKVEGTSEVLHPQDDYYEYPVEVVEGGDTGDTGGDDTGPDDTGPDDTDDTAVVDDTDTDSGDSDTPDDTDTDGNGETPKDGNQGGCNSCASTPMPDASLAVFGLALAGTLMRRRKQA